MSLGLVSMKGIFSKKQKNFSFCSDLYNVKARGNAVK